MNSSTSWTVMQCSLVEIPDDLHLQGQNVSQAEFCLLFLLTGYTLGFLYISKSKAQIPPKCR
jgi:hypothetical protein